MKVIILAAGRGTRISKKIGDIPKSMVDVGGEPLLNHTINMLKKYIPEENISVIVGYKSNVILDYFKNSKIHFYKNPFYPITNSIASLWFAKDQIVDGEDLIIGNADVFWSDEIYNKLVNDSRPVVMLSDRTRRETGDYFFQEGKDSEILKYGKELTLEERTTEYLGVAKIDKSFVMQFKERLLKLLDEFEFDKWWENILYSFVGEQKIYTLDVEGLFWAEVDYIEDYERILDYVRGNKK